MANIKAWITVNGRHIPIMEGESKAKALANHFRKITKNKNEDFEQKRLNEFKSKRDELKNKYDNVNGKNSFNEYEANVEADLYMKEKYGRKYWAMRQIKGYKKSRNDDKDERELDKLNSAIQRAKGYDSNGRASGRPDWQTVRALQDKKQKLITDINKDNKYKSYKLKEGEPIKVGDRYTNENGTTVEISKATKYGTPQVKVYNKKGDWVDTRFMGKNGDDLARLLKDYGYTKNGTSGKVSKLAVKNAYEKYMKEHPNSKMKLSAFEKTYKK